MVFTNETLMAVIWLYWERPSDSQGTTVWGDMQQMLINDTNWTMYTSAFDTADKLYRAKKAGRI